ncbi:hypothetical protein C8Q77DRAFT_1074688 [Trametes polyzona]|nr:hypothetical protein C8Q77DRAFT_1074688 [Trametes polyzona]
MADSERNQDEVLPSPLTSQSKVVDAEVTANESGTNLEPAQASPIADDTPTFLQNPPSLQELLKQRTELYSKDEIDQAWSDAADLVKTYSDDMIRRWNSEIDTYLVYVRPWGASWYRALLISVGQAGLFSAILTAFNVQSYPLLQQTYPDLTPALLQQISLQLSRLQLLYGLTTHVHQFHTSSSHPSGNNVRGDPLFDSVAKCSLVLESHSQPVRCVHWHHGQTVAQ